MALETNENLIEFRINHALPINSSIKKKLTKNKELPLLILLLCRTFQPESVLHHEYLPLDLFKLIIEMSGIHKFSIDVL